jgi:NAD(P)H-dependent FMN reductase
MKIAIISGSHRDNSESERVGRFIKTHLGSLGVESHLISLANNPIPLWDEEVWSDSPRWSAVWGPISQTLQECSAIVVISPEWAGMVPPALKNFMLLCSTADVAHKPALIVAVSAGLGGSYPVNELRISSYKNNRLLYIPDHVIVRNVGSVLHGDAPQDEGDTAVRKRFDNSLKILIEYGKALSEVRASGVINFKEHPYGM